MKAIFTLAWIILLALPIDAQTAIFNQVPQLEAELKTQSDSLRINIILNELAYAYLTNDVDKSLYYAKEAEALADRNNYPAERAKALHQLGEVALKKNQSKQTLMHFEQALEQALDSKDKIVIGLSYQKMGKIYQTLKQEDKAIEYYNKSMAIREELNDEKGLSSLYNNLCFLYMNKSDYDQAMQYAEKAIIIRRKLGNKKDLAVSLRTYTNLLLSKGEMDKALISAKESLECSESLNDLNGKALANSVIGNILLEKGEYKDALNHFNTAEEMAINFKDSLLLSSYQMYKSKTLYFLGDYKNSSENSLRALTFLEKNPSTANASLRIQCYTQMLMNHAIYGSDGAQKWYDKGMSLAAQPKEKHAFFFNMAKWYSHRHNNKEFLNYAQLAYDLKEVADPISKALSYGQLGVALSKNEQLDKALPLLEKSKQELNKLNSTLNLYSIENEISNIYSQNTELDKRKKALEISLKNLKAIEEKAHLPELEKTYMQISSNYEALGDKKNALLYLQKRNAIHDQIIKHTDLKSVAVTEATTELNHEVVKKEQAIQEIKTDLVESKKSTFLIKSLLVLLAISSLITFWLIRKRNNNKLRMQELELRKNIAEAELKLLLDRKRISQDLHDEVGSTLSSINILSNMDLNKWEDQVQKQRLETIGESARAAMDSISDIVWAINPNNESTESLITRMTQYTVNTLEPLGVNIKLNIDDQLLKTKLTIDKKKDIYLIYKEIINNCAKYSTAKNVKVDFYKDGNQIVLSIEDDGIGFNENALQKSLNNNGLKNVRNRINQLEGTFELQSQFGQGTKAKISFPHNTDLVINNSDKGSQ